MSKPASLEEIKSSIENLEKVLSKPGVEADEHFDFLVDTAFRYMQRFSELTGYSWGVYKEMTS